MKRIKKSVALIILVVLVSRIVSAFGYDMPAASAYELTSRVNINGMLDSTKAGQQVTVLLVKKDASTSNMQKSDIGYMDQATVNADGSYAFKFKYTGDIGNYEVMMYLDDEIVTPSVVKATAISDILNVDLDLMQNNSIAKAVLTIDNLYGAESISYILVLAFYNEAGRLVGVKTTDKKMIQSGVTNDQLIGNIPLEAKTMKAFVWEGTERVLPLRKAENSSIEPFPTPTPIPETFKILAIGNSFSQDAATYLKRIAQADGVDLTIVNLYIGSSSLSTHWNHASNDTKAFEYQLNGGAGLPDKVSIREVLESDDWNYVTMQQVSNNSGRPETYYPYIELLAKYVKEIEPQAELLIHQTWAYEKGSDHSGFPYYNSDQVTMFNALKSAYDQAAVTVGALTLDDGTEISPNKAPLRIIPCGKAFQNARENAIFDTVFGDGNTVKLNSDGYHASAYGRYLLGAVWYETITGNKIAGNTFRPSGIAQDIIDILKKAAHDAVVEYGLQAE